MKIQTTITKLRSTANIQAGQLDLCLLASFLFLAWSAVFLWQTSFTAINGQYYFSLFDDTMISMRYAWNLSHGTGLVWNAGEHVEGYGDLLMTLIMSVATFLLDKKLAVLAVQLLGIPTVLGIAFVTRQLAQAAPTGKYSPRRPGLYRYPVLCANLVLVPAGRGSRAADAAGAGRFSVRHALAGNPATNRTDLHSRISRPGFPDPRQIPAAGRAGVSIPGIQTLAHERKSGRSPSALLRLPSLRIIRYRAARLQVLVLRLARPKYLSSQSHRHSALAQVDLGLVRMSRHWFSPGRSCSWRWLRSRKPDLSGQC